mgnify:CR=1 FL=1|tara:strand:+ start:44912 stop:45361 length:450 start_codon:yes stop_codon:yes gene_type:complete
MITFIKTNYQNDDFKLLVKALDADLSVKDGDEHDFYHQFNGIEGLQQVILVYNLKQPVGCGAFKPIDSTTVEIKRMFVLPEFQGKGIGSKILKELEVWASALNYKTGILETGIRQPDAIALYTKNNYEIIPNYGQYKGVDNSVCFKKKL